MARVKIKKIIRKIFPHSFTKVKRIIHFLVAVITFCTLYGCGSSRMATQSIKHVSVDIFYFNTKQYDSIYIYQDRLIDRLSDTIYLKDVSVEYRYKLLRDTIRLIQRDSIPYAVTITEIKEHTRPLIAYDKACRITFWLVVGFLLSFIAFKLKFKYRP